MSGCNGNGGRGSGCGERLRRLARWKGCDFRPFLTNSKALTRAGFGERLRIGERLRAVKWVVSAIVVRASGGFGKDFVFVEGATCRGRGAGMAEVGETGGASQRSHSVCDAQRRSSHPKT
jgi:hypothetical protein